MCRFQFCIERFQIVGRLLLGHIVPKQLRLSRGRPESQMVAARLCTRSSRFAASEPTPFLGADSIISVRLLQTCSKGRAAPTGIGGGLKSSKSTIASFWFSRNKI